MCRVEARRGGASPAGRPRLRGSRPCPSARRAAACDRSTDCADVRSHQVVAELALGRRRRRRARRRWRTAARSRRRSRRARRPGTTRVEQPHRHGLVGQTTRPDSSRSAAWVTPTSRGSSQDRPYSAGSPSCGAAVVSLAPAAAKRRSQKQASTRPTPAQAPFTAAMTGRRSAEVPREVVVELGPDAVARAWPARPAGPGRSRRARRAQRGPGCRRPRRTRRRPVTTTTRTSGSASSCGQHPAVLGVHAAGPRVVPVRAVEPRVATPCRRSRSGGLQLHRVVPSAPASSAPEGLQYPAASSGRHTSRSGSHGSGRL